MSINVSVTLRKALRHLESEREKIDGQIAAIQNVLGAGLHGRGPGPAAGRARKPMGAAARRAVSVRMKTYWAKQRAAKGKS